MAAFGDQNYATPFGAVKPSDVYDTSGSGFYNYSGFSSRSGVSGFSSLCGPNGLEFIPYKPTLTFPLNFTVLSGATKITWKEASPKDACGDMVFYELQFTRTFSQNSGWKTVALDIPSGTTSYVFDVSNIPFTQDGGLRIRARDSKFLYSDYSTCHEAFIIANHAPNPTAIISPLPNDIFDYCLPVIWRPPAVKDLDGHAITYQIEMTDKFSANAEWNIIPGAGSLPDGTTSFSINCFDFPDGGDYGVRLSVVDEMGLASAPVSIGPLTIKHQGSFIVDTVAPDGSMAINDGASLATNTKVKLTLFAFDATTGVKDVRFKNAEEDCWSDFDSFTNEKFWDLPSSDGVKRIFVQYRDYAGNFSEVCNCEIVSRVLCGEGNVSDIEVFNNKLYVAFDAKGNLLEYRVLVNTAATLPEANLTALAKMGNFLYISTYDTVIGATVYTFDGAAKKIFTITGSKILSMVSYNSSLYMGLNDGRIMSYDGVAVTTVLSAASAITRLRTDGAVLYASVQGGGEFLSTIDGLAWKTNTF